MNPMPDSIMPENITITVMCEMASAGEYPKLIIRMADTMPMSIIDVRIKGIIFPDFGNTARNKVGYEYKIEYGNQVAHS